MTVFYWPEIGAWFGPDATGSHVVITEQEAQDRMSRFDRPDPSLDADYCNGLAPEPVEPEPLCLWCNEPLPLDQTDYCSAFCANLAERDSAEG